MCVKSVLCQRALERKDGFVFSFLMQSTQYILNKSKEILTCSREEKCCIIKSPVEKYFQIASIPYLYGVIFWRKMFAFAVVGDLATVSTSFI